MDLEQRPLVRQPSLSAQVVSDLRDQIINRRLTPGTGLPSERELCEHYGVSRTVIREAIKVLSAKGLVTSTPGSGLVVGRTELTDVSDMLQLFMRHGSYLRYHDLHAVRMTIETAVARQAAVRAGDDDVRQLHDLCDDMGEAAGDIVALSENDLAFHRAIALASGNEFWVLTFDVLGGALTETRVATFSMDPSRFHTVLAAHRKIASAIGARDPEAAGIAMADHLIEVKTTWDQHPEMTHDASSGKD